MAGNPGAPAPPDPNPFRKAKPKVTTFSCGKCGAPVTVRYPGHSLSAVCDSCYSVIDTSDDTFRVLDTYYKQMEVQPRIDLGSRGELQGKTWEVIGFVVRQDIASSFKWEEYLLFNPYYGYRWLTCNNGHWSFVTMLKERPEHNYVYAERGKDRYKIFYHGKAEVYFVYGEFYWKVKVGESVEMHDYIAPPNMLSREQDGSQRVWSFSEYLEPKVVEDAFKVPDGSIPVPVGVAPNQPSPATAAWKKVAPMWAIFLVLLTFLEFVHCGKALNKVEFAEPFPYMVKQEGAFNLDPKKTESLTSKVFKLDKDNANVEITLEGNVDNSWLYLYGELVNDETSETFSFERTIEYYHGYDGGESWSEGSRTQKIFINNVPGGNYYLNLDIDNGGSSVGGRNMFTVQVKRDVATFVNYFWCLFFISIYPMMVWLRSRAVEVARWSDSDYSPYRSSTD